MPIPAGNTTNVPLTGAWTLAATSGKVLASAPVRFVYAFTSSNAPPAANVVGHYAEAVGSEAFQHTAELASGNFYWIKGESFMPLSVYTEDGVA